MAASALKFNPNVGPRPPYYSDMTMLTLLLALQAVEINTDDPTYRAVVQMDNV